MLSSVELFLFLLFFIKWLEWTVQFQFHTSNAITILNWDQNPSWDPNRSTTDILVIFEKNTMIFYIQYTIIHLCFSISTQKLEKNIFFVLHFSQFPFYYYGEWWIVVKSISSHRKTNDIWNCDEIKTNNLLKDEIEHKIDNENDMFFFFFFFFFKFYISFTNRSYKRFD